MLCVFCRPGAVTTGPVVCLRSRWCHIAFVIFSLMHIAWWGALRKPNLRRIDLAKKASYVHIVLFISATLNNSPQNKYGIMETAPPIPDDKIVMAVPPLLIVMSCINALLLRSISVAKLE